MAAKVQPHDIVPKVIMSAYSHEALANFFGSHDVLTAKSLRDPERRHRARTLVHWPVLFFRDRATEAIETQTQNLSSSGFYCLSRTPLTPGELLFCTLRVPSHEASGKKSIRILECRVRVIRSEEALTEGYFGIACHIEDYRFAAPHES